MSHNFIGENKSNIKRGAARGVASKQHENLKSLRERRDSPSVQIKPFSLQDNDGSIAGRSGSFKIEL